MVLPRDSVRTIGALLTGHNYGYGYSDFFLGGLVALRSEMSIRWRYQQVLQTKESLPYICKFVYGPLHMLCNIQKLLLFMGVRSIEIVPNKASLLVTRTFLLRMFIPSLVFIFHKIPSVALLTFNLFYVLNILVILTFFLVEPLVHD
jgi:hypothetical protein